MGRLVAYHDPAMSGYDRPRGSARRKPRTIGQGIFGTPAGAGWGFMIFCCVVLLLITLGTLGTVIYNSTQVKGDHFKHKSNCDDGNVCTRDLKVEGGACVHHFENRDHRCESACFVHDDPDPEDDDEDSGHRCDAEGNCVGWRCCGDCKFTRQCPDIEFKYGTVAYADKDCQSKGCVYSAFAPVLLETPCNNPFATEICAGFLDKRDNKTDCLKITPVCEHPRQRRYGSRDGEEEEETTRNGGNDDVSTIAFCLYDFECSEFCHPTIVRRGGGEEPIAEEAKGLERTTSSSEPMKMDLSRAPPDAEIDDTFDDVIESYRSKRAKKA